MGFFKHSKKPKKAATEEETPQEGETLQAQGTTQQETTPSKSLPQERTIVESPKLRKKSSIKGRLSSESMKRLRIMREIGQCLRLIGDDVDRRSSNGSMYDVCVKRYSTEL